MLMDSVVERALCGTPSWVVDCLLGEHIACRLLMTSDRSGSDGCGRSLDALLSISSWPVAREKIAICDSTSLITFSRIR